MSDEVANKDLLEAWESFNKELKEVELDVVKNAVKGNGSAGARARKSLRSLRSQLSHMVKVSVEGDKLRAKTK